MTEHDVRNKFALQEAIEEQSGVVPSHDITPSGFIVTLLELEEQQYVSSRLLVVRHQSILL